MRVSFLGKGGSGKTTMATSFIRYLEAKNKQILAIDADINVHLSEALNIQAPHLGDSFNELSNYFEKNLRKKGAPVIGTLTPNQNSKFIKPDLEDEFFGKFAKKEKNLALITIGSYGEDGVGYSCYHGKLASAALIYNRLLDGRDFYVVSDLTAGIDAVGTSMFGVSDINIFVVEPTKKSVQVYLDFIKITKDYTIPTYVIANKIDSSDDRDFIHSYIEKMQIIGYVKSSDNLKKYEQGQREKFADFNTEIIKINKEIFQLLKVNKKNWNKYYEVHKKIYLADAATWYSQFHGKDLSSYIDPDFNYEEMLEKYEIAS